MSALCRIPRATENFCPKDLQSDVATVTGAFPWSRTWSGWIDGLDCIGLHMDGWMDG